MLIEPKNSTAVSEKAMVQIIVVRTSQEYQRHGADFRLGDPRGGDYELTVRLPQNLRRSMPCYSLRTHPLILILHDVPATHTPIAVRSDTVESAAADSNGAEALLTSNLCAQIVGPV